MESNFSQDQGNFMEAWTRLIQNTFAGPDSAPGSIPPAGAGGAQTGDPWSSLINRLWHSSPFLRQMPYEPAEISNVFQQIWLSMLNNPAGAWATYTDFMQSYSQVMVNAALRFWGGATDLPPVAEPEKGDKRFAAPDWQQNAAFDAIKQSYLLTATTLLKSTAEAEGLDARQQRKLTFYLRQFLDAISPTNFAFTNPQVIHATLQSGGRNLVTGLHNLLRDFQAGEIKMTDTEAFTPGRNLALTPGQVVLRNPLIELIQYAPSTPQVHTVPLLFIPPWINKFYILDMQPHNSLIKYMVDQGFTVFVVSWKNPDASLENTGFEDYMELGLLSAFRAIQDITGQPHVHPVGYCIGGTLLSMTLPYLAARGDETVPAATFFVALQDFSEVGETAVFIDEPQVNYIEGQMLERGYLDSRNMSSMFNMLRANDLIWSNVVNNYLLGQDPPAFDLLYWNADSTRMTRAAHSFYLRNTYLENNLVKPCHIVLKDVPIDLGRITQDIYAVGAEQDHIVPWQSAWRVSQLTGSQAVRFVVGGSGHIAGVISPPAKGRGFWTNDAPASSAAEWLEKAERHPGSWWPDWAAWLKPRCGPMVDPPPLGSDAFPALDPAPGRYVLEK